MGAAVARRIDDHPRILIIDDDPVSGNLLAAVLDGQGFIVEVVDKAEEGLARLARPGIDLVVLDLYMPRTAGWEMLPKIRQRWSVQDLPVIMLSSETNPAVQSIFVDLGANEFLSKPFTPSTLLASIRHWVNS